MLIEMLAAAAVFAGAGQEFAPQLPGGPERVAPRGNYRDSCSGEYVNRGRLYADTLSAPDGPAPSFEAMFRHNLALLVPAMLGEAG